MTDLVTIKTIENGTTLSQEFISEFLERTAVQKNGTQWIGDYIRFYREFTNSHIEDINQLNQAPEKTTIIINEHYVGRVYAVKHNDKWIAVNITYINQG